MGSLVQSPEVADAVVSGIQASVKPTGSGGGIGSFLSKLLPAANAELEKYDAENKDRVFALGQNDKMSGVMNEVGLLDRKNYQNGRTYQTVVNGQIVLTQKFQQEVQSADPATFDPEEQLAKARQFTTDSVNNIYDSELPADIKAKMYQAQLKENAVYMGMVESKVKQITADNASNARDNARAELTRNLTEQTSAEAMGLALTAYSDKRVLAERTLDPSKSLDDVKEVVAADIKASMSYIMKSLKAAGKGTDMAQLALLSEAADTLADLGYTDLATEVQGNANEFSAGIQSIQTAQRRFEVDQFTNGWDTDPDSRSKEAVMAFVGALGKDESIAPEERFALMNKILNKYSDKEAKLLEAEEVVDPRQYTVSGYAALGKSESEYAKDVLASFLKDDPTNPATGGIKALQFFSTSAEYSKEGISQASKTVFGVLLGSARMSDAEAANDQFADLRKEQFNITAMMYNKFSSENKSKAYDLLSGIPDEYVDAFSAAFETGKSLEDVRRMFQNPVSTQEIYKGIETVTNDTASITKALDLGNELFGGFDGQGRASMSDGVEQPFANEIITMMKGSKAFFAGNSQISTATSLVSKYVNSGGLIPSPNGYSSIVMDLGVAKQVQAFRVTGTNTPLNTQYFASSIDAERQKYAKTYGTSPSNVVVKSDATGQQMHFMVFESTGLRGKGEPVLKAEGTTSLARIKKDAETLYQADSTRKASQAGQDARYMNTKIGQAMVADLATGRQGAYSINAAYAKGMGGNLGIATKWVQHMQAMENFTSQGTQTKDANTGRLSFVYGHGMTKDTLQSPAINMYNEVLAARGNVQAMIDVQGKFVQKYYSGFEKELAVVGLPNPNSGMYSAAATPSLMLMLDVKWHAGSTGGLAKAMNAKSYKEGRRILQRLSTYNRSKLGSRRNMFMEDSLAKHYKMRGLL